MRFRIALAALALTALTACSSASDGGPDPTETSSASASATEPPSETPTPTPPPGAAVRIECYDVDKDKTYVYKIVNLRSPQAELAKIWPRKFTSDCDVTRTAGPLTTLEQRALAASRYRRRDLKYLYEFCAENDPHDVYAEKGFTPSKEQIPELRGWLIMCPKHPNAKAWKAVLRRGEEEQKLVRSGRTFESGTFRVGKEIKPGTYAITGKIENCYWERQARSGATIDNGFIPSARRVEVTIRSTDYAFSSDGCGTWRPSK